MKIHMSWFLNTWNMRCGYIETSAYILRRDSGYLNPEETRKIVAIGNNYIFPRVDIYIPLGASAPMEYIDSINEENIERNILCSSQYMMNNNRPDLSASFITKNDYTGDIEQYLRNLKASKFCLSPHGSEPDCYRHWEAMYMGCIPITIKHKVLEDFYDLPMLFLDSWDDLTEELLLSKYEELLPRFSSEKLEEEYWVNLLDKL